MRLLPVLLFACSQEPEPVDKPTDDTDTPVVEDDCAVTGFDWGWGGDEMLPGTDCLSCHSEGERAETIFTVAGTIFTSNGCEEGLAGATVSITDDVGTTLDLVSNEVGNFFDTTPLVPPLRVTVKTDAGEHEMESAFDSGSCGACHELDSFEGLVSGPTGE